MARTAKTFVKAGAPSVAVPLGNARAEAGLRAAGWTALARAAKRAAMKPAEIAAVQAHLRRLLGSQKIMIRASQTRNGPVELLADGETIGTVDRDAEDGEVAYHVTISVLAEDLPQG